MNRLLIMPLALLAAFAAPVYSQTALKTLDNPSGGKIVYGLVDRASSVFCSGRLSPMGQYANIAFHSAVPEAGAARQRVTMAAQPPRSRHAAAAQAQQAHEMSDRHNEAVEARWNSQDKRNQAFARHRLESNRGCAGQGEPIALRVCRHS
ncbi:MAG TPA: hypothetical protein VIY68_13570 [Steroidobacteraceae bacterium]